MHTLPYIAMFSAEGLFQASCPDWPRLLNDDVGGHFPTMHGSAADREKHRLRPGGRCLCHGCTPCENFLLACHQADATLLVLKVGPVVPGTQPA